MNWDWNSWWQDYRQRNPTWLAAKSGLNVELAKEQPGAVYSLWSGYQTGPKTYQDWLTGQQHQKYYNQYQGAALTDPTLQWQDWLDKINPTLDYRSSSPNERGERPSAFAGRSRWVI